MEPVVIFQVDFLGNVKIMLITPGQSIVYEHSRAGEAFLALLSEVSHGKEVIKAHVVTVLLKKQAEPHKLVYSARIPSYKCPAQEQPAHPKTIFPYNITGIAPQKSM